MSLDCSELPLSLVYLPADVAMPKRVAIIAGVFSIEGRGTVIALPHETEWSLPTGETIHPRERIQIRIPDGACIPTFVKDIEMINRRRTGGGIALVLPKSDPLR